MIIFNQDGLNEIRHEEIKNLEKKLLKLKEEKLDLEIKKINGRITELKTEIINGRVDALSRECVCLTELNIESIIKNGFISGIRL